MKKYIGFSILLMISFLQFTFAQTAIEAENDFSIIPKGDESTVKNAVKEVGSQGGQVMKNYKDQVYGKKNAAGVREGASITAVGDQLASGIMNRDTLLDYVSYIVRFLLQIGLLIGAAAIIYLGYKKMTAFRDLKDSPLGNVIKGVLVISFAYVIIKTIVAMFIT